MFNERCQQEVESINAFVTDLHVLVKTCDFKGLEDEFICDRIVVGCRDVILYETLIIIPDLTLEGAVKRAHHNEIMKSQQKILQPSEKDNVEQLDEDAAVHMADSHYRKKKTYKKKEKPLKNYEGNNPKGHRQHWQPETVPPL